MNDTWRPDPAEQEPGGSLRAERPRNPARRAVAAAGAAYVALSQSRGLFAVIGATVATSVFVLFSWLPNNNAPSLSPPTYHNHTDKVGPEAVTNADNKTAQTGPGSNIAPVQAGAQPSLTPTPLDGAQPVEPEAEGVPPAQQGQAGPGGPTPDPAPGRPTPRTPPADPPVLQGKRVVLSTKAGRDSVGIDSWQRRNSDSNDLHMDGDGIYTTLNAQLSVVEAPGGNLTYRDCAQRTTWVTRVNFADLHKGSMLCARSNTGNYAAMNVVALPRTKKNNERFVFQGTTWQSPGHPTPRSLPPPVPSAAQTTPSPPDES